MNKPGSSYRHRLMAAMALLSVALIAYQVAIIQLLSYVQWYHFANVVISIALLGFGAAGTLLSLYRSRILKHSEVLLPLLIGICGLMMIVAVELGHSSLARFDSYLLFTARQQWLRLLATSLFYLVPFLLGALALGIVFIKYVGEIGSFYFSNLAGSGLGALLAAVLAGYFLPVSIPYFLAMIAMVAGLLVMRVKSQWYILVAAIALFAFVIYRLNNPVSSSLSQYKSMSRTLNLPGSRIILQKPGAYGLVEVVSADALRYAPGLSLAFDHEVPVNSAIFNNGDWYGPLDCWHASDSFHLLDYTTMAVPFVLKKRDRVLVLHAGSGLHVSQALRQGALEVDAVEPHHGVSQLLIHELARINDSLYYRPGVELFQTEPRSFLSASKKKYDLIQLHLIGAFGGGVGLYAMREEYSLTRQAFRSMWNLLGEDGVISVTAWMDYPYRNALKLTATLAETLEDAGIPDPPMQMAAIRSWATVTYILKKNPFSASEIAAIRAFCSDYFFDPLFIPGLTRDERTLYNGISDSSFFSYSDELLTGNREKLYQEYGFHIRPASDDKPYFSQFLRWKSLPQLAGVFGSQTVSFLELGWLIAALSFLQITLLAILLIIVPLFIPRLRGKNKGWTLLYFSGLGAGYMLLEIVMIQKFILFFGNPVYAAAFVICIMMLASGAGSYYSTRLVPGRPIVQRILLMIFLFLLLYTFSLSPLLNTVDGFPVVIKVIISLSLITLPAILMGMPFPLGLRLLAMKEEKNLPWAWGINGCVSVISASLAALLTVEAGFAAVILLAAFFYGLSLLSMYLIKT